MRLIILSIFIHFYFEILTLKVDITYESSEDNDIFNEQGDLQVEVDYEETAASPNPPPDGAAGDGLPRPWHQQRGRLWLPRGTKRGPYKRVAPDARRIVEVFKAGGIGNLTPQQTACRFELLMGTSLNQTILFRRPGAVRQ